MAQKDIEPGDLFGISLAVRQVENALTQVIWKRMRQELKQFRSRLATTAGNADKRSVHAVYRRAGHKADNVVRRLLSVAAGVLPGVHGQSTVYAGSCEFFSPSKERRVGSSSMIVSRCTGRPQSR